MLFYELQAEEMPAVQPLSCAYTINDIYKYRERGSGMPYGDALNYSRSTGPVKAAGSILRHKY